MVELGVGQSAWHIYKVIEVSVAKSETLMVAGLQTQNLILAIFWLKRTSLIQGS